MRILLALCLAVAALGASAQGLRFDGHAAVDLWPAVGVVVDPEQSFTVDELARAPQRFETPQGAPSNLGRRDSVVWLRVPLDVQGDTLLRPVFALDYPGLNRVDLYVTRDGKVRSHRVLGNSLRSSERPLPTRMHATALELEPGRQELLLRVQTLSSIVLPMTLHTQETFLVAESRQLLVLGIIGGLSLCMALYSLLHWVNLRDSAFLMYALLLVGNSIFLGTYFGLGGVYVWPEHPWLSMHVAPMGILIAVAAASSFMRTTLGVDEISRTVARLMQLISLAALVGLAAALGGLLGYRGTQTLSTVLGLAIGGLVLPVAFVRARKGERSATLLLLGWAFYIGGALVMAGLLRGVVEPTPLAQLVYPLSMMIEMTAWMGVLGLRVQSITRHADRARLEADALRTLAHTDALTGLPNRRGLQLQLAAALARNAPPRVVAVYLIDLDGFKPVNDRWGHDVGDALLIAIGQRLQSQLRASDVVARLGGDEFVVLASGLPDEQAAQRLGHKLLAVFDAPIAAGEQHCSVGATIGYALAPHDGREPDELLKRADAAMYAGKEAGRHRVQRGGRTLLPA